MAETFGGADKVPGEAAAIASSGQQLALAMSGGQIALLDAHSAELKKSLPVAAPTAVVFSPEGKLFTLSEGQLAEVNLDNGSLRVIPTPGRSADQVFHSSGEIRLRRWTKGNSPGSREIR